MKSNINGKMLAIFFVAAAAIASAMGTTMITPAFAQGDNMTGYGLETHMYFCLLKI